MGSEVIVETDENKEEELKDDNILNKKVDNKISNAVEVPEDKKGTIKDTKEKNKSLYTRVI